METKVPLSIDAIVSALETAGLTVWDGPIVTGDFADAVIIGYDGASDDAAEFRAASTTQDWAGMGQRARNEDDQIMGAVVVLRGDTATKWKPTRDAAYALLHSVGQLLRSDPSLGQAAPFTAELWPGDLFQEPGPYGYQARIVFAIHIKTRV